jgi:hypothetical protein
MVLQHLLPVLIIDSTERTSHLDSPDASGHLESCFSTNNCSNYSTKSYVWDCLFSSKKQHSHPRFPSFRRLFIDPK